jgi:hypothetical protein
MVCVAAVLASCSLVVETDTPQCNIDDDCAARGPGFSGAVCERNVCVLPASPADGNSLECTAAVDSGLDTVEYSFAIQLPTGAGAGVETPFRVQACHQLDLECKQPVAGPFDVVAGTVYDFPVPHGFSGFFQIESERMLPALYFVPRPVVTDTVGWSPTVISQEVLAQLAAAAGASLDPESGIVIASIRDCDGVPIEGAIVTASEQRAIRYYIVNNLPVLSATETSAQGAVGFANAPATTIALQGVTKSGKTLAPVSIRVQAGSLSLVEIRP